MKVSAVPEMRFESFDLLIKNEPKSCWLKNVARELD